MALAALAPGAAPTTAADTQPPRRVESVTRGAVRATLGYRNAAGETVEARLRIFRSGRLLVDDRLLPLCRSCGVVPKGARGGSSLSVLDLDGDADLEVLVDLGLGGNYDIPYTYFYFQRRPSSFSTSVTFDRISRSGARSASPGGT